MVFFIRNGNMFTKSHALEYRHGLFIAALFTMAKKQFREPTEFSTFYSANLKSFVKASYHHLTEDPIYTKEVRRT